MSSEWIKWTSGSCPVAEDVWVDIQMDEGRDEDIGILAGDVRWEKIQCISDVSAYRIHCPKAEKQPTIEQLLAKANRHAAKAAKHDRKRAELVERAKGMVPAGWKIEECQMVVDEDMTDPVNWKAGDVVEARCHCEAYTKHQRYTVTAVIPDLGWVGIEMDDEGEYNGGRMEDFEWVSRPQGETK